MKLPLFLRTWMARRDYEDRCAVLFDLAFEMCVFMGYDEREAYQEWQQRGKDAARSAVRKKFNIPDFQP